LPLKVMIVFLSNSLALAPVEISGHALPAGTYVFKTLENNRNVVMVKSLKTM